MSPRHADAPPFARQAAEPLVDAFADYNARFADITRRSQRHFEKRNNRGQARMALT